MTKKYSIHMLKYIIHGWTRSFSAFLVQEPNKSFYYPRKCLRVVELIMVASLSAKGLHRCRLCCSWTSPPCQWVWRPLVVS